MQGQAAGSPLVPQRSPAAQGLAAAPQSWATKRQAAAQPVAPLAPPGPAL
jgi:hypothetical protein